MSGKFSKVEIVGLRQQLFSPFVTTWHAAELLQKFLADHGYGSSPEAAFEAASSIEGCGCSLDALSLNLEKMAMVA